MIFWNINKLKTQIINNELSEVNYFLYFFFFSCVGMIGILSIMIREFSYPTFIWMCAFGLLLPLLCFLYHAHYKLTHFVEKFYSIGLVAMIRCSVYLFLFIIASFLLIVSLMFIIKYVAPEKNVIIVESLQDLLPQLQQRSGSFYVGQEIAVYGFIFLYTLKHYRDLCRKFMANRKKDLA